MMIFYIYIYIYMLSIMEMSVAKELVQTSFVQGDPEPWKTWIPYAALLGAAFFAIVNAYFLTKGLQHYEAIPSYRLKFIA